jgi:hypothetical protein
MAHFCKISKIQNADGSYDVIGCYYGRDEDNETALSERTGDSYKKTSYNTKANKYYEWREGAYLLAEDQSKAFRKNYGGAGALYWPEHDGFSAKQPFPSWTLNTTTLIWECPVGYPDVLNDNSIGITHSWNEDLQRWEAFDEDGDLTSTWNTTTNAWETV